jgi:hypothetical protein
MEALKKAAAEPEARQAFYELLMKTTIFVPGLHREGQDGAKPTVSFKQWSQPEGLMAIPFFAEPEELKKVLGEEEPFLPLPALELFRLTRGTTVVLTSADGLSKAFKPDEVDMLLSSVLALDPLAAALETAVREDNDGAKRFFYQVFVNSQVFVFGEPKGQDGEPGPTGARPMGPEDKFSIATINHPQKEGERVIPFFSSSELLHQAARAASLPPQASFLGFSSLDLLKMAKGMGLALLLNPGPMTYKIFPLEEIDFLLANAKPKIYEERQLPAGSKVSLTPPEVYPQELVGALLDFLPTRPGVLAAYLTTLKEESDESAPVLVIGLETEEGEDLTETLNKIVPLVTRHAPAGQTVDFTQVRPGEKGLSLLFLEKINPFYRRAIQREAAPLAPAAPEEPMDRDKSDEAPGFFGRLKRLVKR